MKKDKIGWLGRIGRVFTGNVIDYDKHEKLMKKLMSENNDLKASIDSKIILLDTNKEDNVNLKKEIDELSGRIIVTERQNNSLISENKDYSDSNVILKNNVFKINMEKNKIQGSLNDLLSNIDEEDIDNELLKITKGLNNKKTISIKKFIYKYKLEINRLNKHITTLEKDKKKPSTIGNNKKSLNCKQVIEIRKLSKDGMSQKKIGIKLDVSRSIIQKILGGKTYKNCKDGE